MSSYKFISNGESFDIQAAEVLRVNYKDDTPEQLYSITVKPINGTGIRSSKSGITARPLNYNIKKIPLVGEIVLLLKGPSPGSSELSNSSQNYYLDIYSVQSSIYHNALPNITKVSDTTSFEKESFNDVSLGHPSKDQTKKDDHKFATSFVEKSTTRPIQPYAGDVLLEGRFNQGIRFSSTITKNEEYTVEPSWKSGISTDGDPILIIRNGRTPSSIPSELNKFYVENINDDLSSIWMTSGQQLPFKPKYSNFSAIDRLGVNTFKVGDNYTGNQIGIFSDRIIIGSKSQEIILQSESGVAINSAKSVAFDVEKTFEVNSTLINLGLNAKEPALLGDTSTQWLNSLLTQLITLCNTLAVEVHPTGTGPSLPPLQSTIYTSVANQLIGLQGQLETLKSRLVFLNKI